MATHRVFLGSSVEKQNVGNSMSTNYSWNSETRNFTIFWKYEKPVVNIIPSGIKFVQVRCGGGIPSVIPMYPPKGKVAQIGWENRFYAKMRVASKAEIDFIKESKEASYFSNPASKTGVEFKQYRVEGLGYCFVYSPGNAMGGKYPLKWWAEETADWAEIQVKFWAMNQWPKEIQSWLNFVIGSDDGSYWVSCPEKHLDPTTFRYWGGDWKTNTIWINAKLALNALKKEEEFKGKELLVEFEKIQLEAFFNLVLEAHKKLSAKNTEDGVAVYYKENLVMEFLGVRI